MKACSCCRKSGHVVLFVGPTVTSEQRAEAVATASRLDCRLVHERRVRLEEQDPERFLQIYQRTL